MPLSDDDSDGLRRRARCGGCGQEATWLRRGLCAGCYGRWVRARPVGLGAACAACAEERTERLRHFELRGVWVVLCHGCAARAERLVGPSGLAVRSVQALLEGLRPKVSGVPGHGPSPSTRTEASSRRISDATSGVTWGPRGWSRRTGTTPASSVLPWTDDRDADN